MPAARGRARTISLPICRRPRPDPAARGRLAHENFQPITRALDFERAVVGVIEIFQRLRCTPMPSGLNPGGPGRASGIAIDSAKLSTTCSALSGPGLAYEATIEGWSRAMICGQTRAIPSA